MKHLVILVLLIVTLQSQIVKNRYEAEELCTRKLHLNKSKMKALINEGNTPEDNEIFNHFLICVFTKRDILNNNGYINETRFKDFIRMVFTNDFDFVENGEASVVQHVLQQCRNVKGDSLGLIALRLKNCIVQEIKEYENEF